MFFVCKLTFLQNFMTMGKIHSCRWYCHFPSHVIAIVFLLVLPIIRIECSNLEVRLPMVKEGPLNSLFGFSVAEHIVTMKEPSISDNYDGSLILAGAPTYDDPDALVAKAGAVFKCPLSTYVDDCQDMQLDITANDDNENKTDQWLGVTVRSQGQGGRVATCAHRYKVLSSDKISGLGKCYLRMNDLTQDYSIPGAWTMCRNMELGKKKFGYCQAGTGFYISQKEDSIAGEFIAGIPGAGNWRGGIFTTTVPDEDEINPDLRRTSLDDESAGVGLNSYLGFSVTSGKFGNKFMVASGAPRHNAVGAVVMISKHPLGGLMQEYVLKGEQLAESFGYEVCSADLDGDGFDDLIVGAPIYYNRSTDAGGRVYVYLNKNKNGTFIDIEPIRLTGSRDSMFGISIANLGDLNLDGYEDIAIGAPYENNGVGAVYIYLGGPNGVIQPASQKITPADLPDDLPTSRDIGQAFGYSLSAGLDLDGNQYPDLTIGAFEANALVTLRARPIISITAELLLRETQIDPNVTTKNGAEAFRSYVQVQMKYECNADRFDESISVEYSIEAEEERRDLGLTSRVIFEMSDSYAIRDQTILLQPQSDEAPVESIKFWFTLRPGFTDIFRKIPFKLNYKLPDVTVTTPSPGDPVPDLNPLAILNSQFDPFYVAELDFIKACAQQDGECITDLDVQAYLRLDGDPPVLRVGVHKNLYVTVVVKNNEEPAYDAKLTITFPEMLEFSKIEDDASQLIRYGCNLLDDNSTVIVCKLGYPYKEKQVEAFTLKFDTRDVPSDASNFTIRMSATSTNRDSNPEDNQVNLFAEVQSITDIQIIGQTNKEQYTFEGDVRGESAMTYTDEIGDEVIHTWTVYNNGSGIVTESVVTISFPYEVASGKWLLYLTHEPMVEDNKGRCDIDPSYVNELQLEERPEEPTSNLLTTEASPVLERSPSTNEESPTDASMATSEGRRKRRAVMNEEEGVQRSRAQAQQGKILRLNCYDKTARCFEFKCHMERLGEEDEAKIYVRSRLWKSTFLEDYINAKEVLVSSVGKIEILNAPFLTQSNEDNDVFNLTMEVKPSSVTLPPPEPLAWWIILVAVLVGIIILIILIILLWKVGFFRRPGTRSGGPCGFFERKTMGYKYATVTQKTAGGNAATEKTAYYDEKYFT